MFNNLFKYENKGFWGGEKGHVHGLQEGGAWAITIGFLSWLISPVVGGVLVLVFWFLSKKKFAIPFIGDKYWTDREIKQSYDMVAQGKRAMPMPSDLAGVPDQPTPFWTEDAIADVEFPRSLRKWFALSSVVFIIWMATQTGWAGLLIDWFIKGYTQ